MNLALRPLVATSMASLLLLASACGGGDDAVTLTMSAESSSGEAEVSYRIDSGEQVTETVSTPWEQTIDVSGSFGVDLTVANLAESGMVACGIEQAASSLSNPSATGEAAADCSVSGSSRGGTLTISATSFGTPFDQPTTGSEDDPATQPDDDAEVDVAEVDVAEVDVDADVPDGMSAALLFTDQNGDPIEPAQFDRVWVSIVVEGALGADEVQVLVEGEIDDGVDLLSLNDRERHDADDIDSTGRLVHVLRSIDLDQPGTLRAEFAGKVTIDDVDIPVDDRVVIDVAPTETVIETRVLSGGFVTLDVESVAQTIEDVPARRSVASSETGPMSVDHLEEIAWVDMRASDVSVFQVERSLTTTVEEVADVIEVLFSESADVERVAAQIDGRNSIRIEFVADVSGTGDVLMVDDEILYVQTRWSDAGATARDARDSLRFDPSQLLPPEE